jgi:hypothetical protein
MDFVLVVTRYIAKWKMYRVMVALELGQPSGSNGRGMGRRWRWSS